jgi:tetratricopeptide (TPR) repeat protein
VQTTGDALPDKQRRTWFVPALIAAVSFIGGVASNLLASDLEDIVKKYRPLIWGLCGAAFAAAVVAAVRDHLRPDEQTPALGQSTRENGDLPGLQVQDDLHKIYGIVHPTASALHQLPPPPRDFTGRKAELEELTKKLQEEGMTICGLLGQGGIGKTTLALKLAEILRPDYPEAQFYLDLKGVSPEPLTPAEAMAHVIRAYHPAAQLPEREEELSGLYRSVLDGKRALLVMDNAKDRRQVSPLIPPDGCVLLITSRRHFSLPGMFAKNLETMRHAEARELLLRIAPRASEEADRLAKLCGYLPLALRLAASALAERPDIKPADYLRRLTTAQKRLELIEASLNLSFDCLDEEGQRLWRTLAVFPDTFDTAAAAAVWDLESEAAGDQLGELVKFSLVEWNEEAGRYRLLDLARIFANARIRMGERDEAEKRYAKHYVSVLAEADELYLKGGESIKQGLELFDTEWVNIEAGQAWSDANAVTEREAAHICVDYSQAGPYLLYLRQSPRQRILWLDAAVINARRLDRRPAECQSLGNLGTAYRNTGEFQKSIEAHEQQLATARELGDRRAEGNALCGMGSAYSRLGEIFRAIELYEQSLVALRETGYLRGEGVALGGLGRAYAKLGQFHKAIELFNRRLEIAREIDDRRGEGESRGNLGRAYFELGETRKAVEFHEQALCIHREINNRRGESIDLFYLGVAMGELGERAKAVELAESSLRIAEEIEAPWVDTFRQRLADLKSR